MGAERRGISLRLEVAARKISESFSKKKRLLDQVLLTEWELGGSGTRA